MRIGDTKCGAPDLDAAGDSPGPAPGAGTFRIERLDAIPHLNS